jgi:hypothetical protein
MKWELKKALTDLSSAQLIIKLLQKQGSTSEEVGHGTEN